MNMIVTAVVAAEAGRERRGLCPYSSQHTLWACLYTSLYTWNTGQHVL